jgi:hypothetical protein
MGKPFRHGPVTGTRFPVFTPGRRDVRLSAVQLD